jgi:hypothetical protein
MAPTRAQPNGATLPRAAVRLVYPPGRPVMLLLGLALTLDILLGQFVLLAAGIRYEAEGGNPLVKIHPGSYVALAAAALYLLSLDHPSRVIAALLRSAGGLCLYTAGMAIVLVYALAVHGISGVAFLLDTFLVPGLVALILSQASARSLHGLSTWLIMVLAMNGSLGIAEAIFHRHVFPYLIDGQFVTDASFRATAFVGHPLRNAMLTSMAMMAVAAGAWPRLVKACFIMLFAVALLAFGGRTGFGIGLVGLAALGGREFLRSARTNNTAFVRNAIGCAAVLTLTDLGTRITDGSLGNDSSSQARLQLFDIFRLTDATDLLSGYPGETIDAMAKVTGIIAVENFWIYMLLFLGVLGFALWLPAFLAGLATMWRASFYAGRVLLVCGVVVASANNSLAKKDSSLAIMFALIAGAGAAESRQVRRLALPRAGEALHAA